MERIFQLRPYTEYVCTPFSARPSTLKCRRDWGRVHNAPGVTQNGLSMTESNWWRGAVIYQIYPRSFLDTNGDGVADLPGITERLEYVASLGVDAIWISPFFKKTARIDLIDDCAAPPV